MAPGHNAFAQDESGEEIEQTGQDGKKFALGLGLEWSMNSHNYFAGGAGLTFDYNLSRLFAIGLSIAASSNFAVLTALEPAAMFRWYPWGKNHTGFFVQADVGTFLYFEDEGTRPFVLGGGRAGLRLPLGRTFYIEPYGRGGYPFVFGVGVNAGLRLPAKKRPDTIVKEKIAEEIAEDIERLNIADVSVRVEDEGVTISMDIQFRADTAILLPGEREKLDKIIDILRHYPNRAILVSGHTALAGTAEGRRQLSTARAAVVAEYLIEQKARSPDRVVVRGYGADRPLGDNSTEEGRRKNRRVEITILENQAREN
jgi:outer membrane protein OmpA-like peptidoglycan-associated protein